MHHLGLTRSALRRDHLLQTPAAFVRAPLPGLRKATAIVHISPAGGARFTQYTLEFESGGEAAAAACQRFVYVLEGEIAMCGERLTRSDYAYLPARHPATMSARTAARVAVFEKPYEPLDGTTAPSPLTGRESRVAPSLLGDDPGLEVRSLVPDDAAFDFRVNTMTYKPGAALPAVEIHVMEHGLLMLEGGGIYRLSDCWYPVQAGDFIWMAPYCPQWFGAIGRTAAKYLIYKDWDRKPV